MNKIILYISLFFLVMFTVNAESVEKNSSEKLQTMIAEIELQIDNFKKTNATVYAKNEIDLAKGYLETANQMINDNANENAYLQIQIAMAYVELINAKTRLMSAKRGTKEPFKKEKNEPEKKGVEKSDEKEDEEIGGPGIEKIE